MADLNGVYKMDRPYFPMFIDLTDKKILVAGRNDRTEARKDAA